jgi:hypothetical protein
MFLDTQHYMDDAGHTSASENIDRNTCINTAAADCRISYFPFQKSFLIPYIIYFITIIILPFNRAYYIDHII